MKRMEGGSDVEKGSGLDFPGLPVFEAWAVCLVFFGVAHLKFEFSLSVVCGSEYIPRAHRLIAHSTVASRRLIASLVITYHHRLHRMANLHSPPGTGCV